MIRSWFLVPAGNDGKLAEGLASGADALVFDLSQTDEAEAVQARKTVAGMLSANPARLAPIYIMVHSPMSPMLQDDLEALVPLKPAGVILPRTGGGADLQRLDVMISAREALSGSEVGRIRIVALAGDHAGVAFSGGSYGNRSPRLEALGWWAERAAGSIGVNRMHETDGRLAPPLEAVRALTLLGAGAAGVGAIDTPSFSSDPERFRGECRSARGDGFSGKIAVSAEQAAVINAVFAA